MASKRKQPKPAEFPFKGDDAENLAAARRMANAGLKRRSYKDKYLPPKALALAVLGASSTHRKYREAYMQELAARELDNPSIFDTGNRIVDPPDGFDSLEFTPRVMFLDDGPEAPWDIVGSIVGSCVRAVGDR